MVGDGGLTFQWASRRTGGFVWLFADKGQIKRKEAEQQLSYKERDATDRRGSTIAVLASPGKTRAQKEEEALE